MKQRRIRKGRDLGVPVWTDWCVMPALFLLAAGIVALACFELARRSVEEWRARRRERRKADA